MKKTMTIWALCLIYSFQLSGQFSCFTGSDEPPGCDFRCKKYQGKLAFLDTDSLSYVSSCPQELFTRWISVTAEKDFIKISLDTFTCDDVRSFSVQVFDKNLQSISNCKRFQKSDSGDFLKVENLITGENYSISIQSEFNNYCPFTIDLEGIETDSIGQIDSLRISRNGLTSTVEIDSVFGATEYIWTVDQGGVIVSGQGTTAIGINWTNNAIGNICVIAKDDCQESNLKCSSVYFDQTIRPCLPTAGGIPSGNEAPGCFMCGPIYQGTTEGYTASMPFSAGFPCGDIENNQFLSHIADATGRLTPVVLASNCVKDLGVEMVIYDENFNPVSTCFSSGGVNSPGSVTAENLIPGATYWIMIDGFEGDECEILVTLSGGINCGPPDPPGPLIAEPDTNPLCAGAIVNYRIDHVSGFHDYEWIVPDNSVIIDGGGKEDVFVTLQFTEPGGGIVRVTPSNPCFPGIPAITPIVVLPILPILKPPEFICEDDFPIVRDGNIFQGTGSHEIIYKTGLNCDSIVTYVFLPKVQIPTIIDTTICKGECVQIGSRCIEEQGSYTYALGHPFTQTNGCDSIVQINIKVIEPIAKIVPPNDIDCTGGGTVDLDGRTSSAGNGISYKWAASNGGALAGQDDTNFTQAGAPGRYILTVTQTTDSGLVCTAADTVDVTTPAIPISLVFNTGSTRVCESETHIFSVDPVPNFSEYEWAIPDDAIINGIDNSASVEITFGKLSGVVCVSLKDTCGNSVPTCLPVEVITPDTPVIISDNAICISDTATIYYRGSASDSADFIWNFNGGIPSSVSGKGPHQITWSTSGMKEIYLTVVENGCSSPVGNKMVAVGEILQKPVISCFSTSTSIEFKWNKVPGAVDYTISMSPVISTFTRTDTSVNFTNLIPGEVIFLSVEANSIGNCPSSIGRASCFAQDCQNVTLNITPIPSICLNSDTEIFDLTANPVGILGGGIYNWQGPGVAGNTFDPHLANPGVNQILLEYTEGNCTYTEGMVVYITESPDPSFSVTSPVCEDEPAIITYLGDAPQNTTFNWDFDGGIILFGTSTDPIPFGVDYSGQTGIKNISLELEKSGCNSSKQVEQTIIEPLLSPPVLYCDSVTSNSVFISWDEVPGAVTYTANPPIGILDYGTRTLTIDSLPANTDVIIEIIAEGNNSCGSSRSEITCKTTSCPAVNLTIDSIGPFCDDGKADVTVLSATASGDNTGTFTWNGPGVFADFFDPNASSVNPGIIPISCTYTEGSCSYVSSIDIEILEQPDYDFTVESPICIDSTSTILINQTPGINANLNWDFGSNINSIRGGGTVSDPYEISWNEPKTEEIKLIIEENGCFSQEKITLIQIDDKIPPTDIQCTVDQNNINFSWNSVPGGIDYQAEVISSNVVGLPSQQDGPLSWNFPGLNAGDFIQIQVTVSGLSECGSSKNTLKCRAIDCPDYSVAMPKLEFCLTSDLTSFELLPETQISNINGDNIASLDSINMIWSAPNINHSYLTFGGRFFPTVAVNEYGTGEVPISLEIEYPKGSGCFKTYTSTIELNPMPNNSIFSPKEICSGDTAVVTIGNAPNAGTSFDWDFGNAEVLSGSGGGPYQLVWDSTYFGTTDTFEVEITENGCSSIFRSFLILGNVLDLSAEIEQPIWFPAPPTDIDLTVENGFPDYNFLWSTGDQTEDLIDLIPGATYCVTATDQSGCFGEECYDIGEGIFRVNSAQIICSGQSVNLSVRPGRGADFEWFPSEGLSCADCPNPTASPSKSTTYNVTATMPDGRFATKKVLVIALPAFFCNQLKVSDNSLKSLEEELEGKTKEYDLVKIEKEIIDYLTVESIEISPNPTNGKVTVSAPIKLEMLEVFDFSGRKIITEISNEIDLSGYSQGIYFFKIKTESETVTKRVILF